jgi:hypothetical protein
MSEESGESDRSTTFDASSLPRIRTRPSESAESPDPPRAQAMGQRAETAGAKRDRTPSGGDPWKFAVLMIFEAGFVLGVMVWVGLDATQAVWVATRATSLAVVAVFAKPAVIGVGHRLQLTEVPGAAHSSAAPPALIATILLELTVVLLAIVTTGLHAEQALRLAAQLTLLCMSAIYGGQALLVVGRRVFSSPTGG